MNKFLKLILSFLLLILPHLASAAPFPAPKGGYQVGTTRIELTDSSRYEYFSENQVLRKFIARIWYPAEISGDEERLPIIESHYAEASEKIWGSPKSKEELSNSYINAKVQSAEELYPILIFTHGLGSYPTQNLTNFEELTSRGYIVISLAFPYETISTRTDDGKIIEMYDIDGYLEGMTKLQKDKEFAADYAQNIDVMKLSNYETSVAANRRLAEQYKIMFPHMERWLQTRVEDIDFLISQLPVLEIQGTRLPSVADINQLGLFGHSFGAITTTKYLLEYDNPAVKGGIGLDSPYTLASEDIGTLEVPLLFMTSDTTKFAGNKVDLLGTNKFLQHHSRAPIYECQIKKTTHLNFTDLNYGSALLRFTPILGSIRRKNITQILDHYLLVFFDSIFTNNEPWFENTTQFKETSLHVYEPKREKEKTKEPETNTEQP